MRTLSPSELTAITGGFACKKRSKKPKCVKLPKPTKRCEPKPPCTIEIEPPAADPVEPTPAPAG